MGDAGIVKLTGNMTWEVNGSASCKNKMMENWAHGRGVFLLSSATPSASALPLMLGVRLPWFEDPAKVAVSEPDSDIASISEAPLPASKGVRSSGRVGIAAAMIGNWEKRAKSGGARRNVEGRLSKFNPWCRNGFCLAGKDGQAMALTFLFRNLPANHSSRYVSLKRSVAFHCALHPRRVGRLAVVVHSRSVFNIQRSTFNGISKRSSQALDLMPQYSMLPSVRPATFLRFG